MSEIGVQHPVADFWATRPRRRTGEGKIAGVAAAIGRRYAIDPVLVRVAFVVATLFSGVGVLLYLLGWLLLPAETSQVSGTGGVVGRGRGVLSAALTIVLVALLVTTARAVFTGRASGVLALAVAVGVLVLLHRSRAALGETPGSLVPAAPPGPTAPDRATPAPNTTIDGAGRPVPPTWDPLGWHRSPGTYRNPQRRHRTPHHREVPDPSPRSLSGWRC